MIMNEYRLNLGTPEAQQFLIEQTVRLTRLSKLNVAIGPRRGRCSVQR